MVDQTTLAYVNLNAVLGALPELIRLDDKARALLARKKPVRLSIAVKDGPSATLAFADQAATFAPGVENADILLPLKSPAAFNDMIAGVKDPFPRKGLTRIFFLLKTFKPLTDQLAALLRTPSEELGESDRRIATELMLYVIGAAIAEIGNHDPIGQFSASNLVDGDVMLSIADGPAVTITVKDHVLTAKPGASETPRAVMEFSSFALARQLFDGKVNAVAAIGTQDVRMRGMISMLESINHILDRVPIYLA